MTDTSIDHMMFINYWVELKRRMEILKDHLIRRIVFYNINFYKHSGHYCSKYHPF
jgi:hypothetical protein